MQHARLGRMAALVLTIAILLDIAAAGGAWAQSATDIDRLNRQAVQVFNRGDYEQGTALAENTLARSERALGRDHPVTLSAVNNLAALYQARGRASEAEPLFRRALEARERVLGKEHSDTLSSVNSLAVLYLDEGLYAEAEPLLRRALEAQERVLGREHPNTLRSLDSLAVLYYQQGRYSEAEPLFRRTLEACERVFGKEHPHTLAILNNLAELYDAQGRYGEAEPLLKRALEAQERVLGKEHPETLFSLNNLALLYQTQGRYSEAEPLFRRALEARERVLGKEHPDTLTGVASLAGLYGDQGRYGEAEPLYRRVLGANERLLGKEHPQTLDSVNNLAALYVKQGRYGEAEPLYRRALEARERVLGREHPSTLVSVSNLAFLYFSQGRYGEAEPLSLRALETRQRVLGKEHPATLSSLNNLAGLYFTQRDWTRAAQFLRLSTAGIAGRTQRNATATGQAATGKKESEAERNGQQFWILVKAVYRLARQGQTPDAAASRETFETAQWAAGSEAAKSLAQMSARGVRNDPALAALARERQDLVIEWQKRDAQRNEWFGNAHKRDAKAESENNARLAAIDARIGEIDKQLAAEFPDYAALANPAPAAMEEVQAQLRPDEALVLFLDTPEIKPAADETFIWVVTKTDVRWVRSELGTEALKREVQVLRCGLDAAATAQRCAELTGQTYTSADNLLPFDYARAYKLYQALFGQVEDLIKGKSLLLVPSGPLTQLPFQVLVTQPPASGDYKSAAWLIRDHAITVLPAVSSLKALRRVARPSAAPKPLIGFGNPLLDGDPAYAEDRQRAQDARDFNRCPVPQRVASNERAVRAAAPVVTRGGLADVAFLRRQAPLPETASELCAVARDLHAEPGDIYLGARATERDVKALSVSGRLAQYRIVHFATHGALAGQVSGNSEPGLLLTPPAKSSEEDDGYLTASEIAGLKLDADWVILSACNTAGGGEKGAEALSGLARAFIYAQARALLVSHWAVNSDATVKLITGAMSRLAADKSMGRAEALRQSMLALIDGGEPHEAHPAFWAPFVVVGEGGTGR